jgi:ribosomal protein S18 acetylase RimI-like enzyme
MTITITKATHDHIPGCEEALRLSQLGDNYFNAEGRPLKIVLDALEHGRLYAALCGGDTVGFMSVALHGMFDHFPYLNLISIKPDYRGKGIGQQMMAYFEDVICAEYSRFFLIVASFNPDAKRFYERLGYQQIGVIPGLYREHITEYIMMKERKA